MINTDKIKKHNELLKQCISYEQALYYEFLFPDLLKKYDSNHEIRSLLKSDALSDAISFVSDVITEKETLVKAIDTITSELFYDVYGLKIGDVFVYDDGQSKYGISINNLCFSCDEDGKTLNFWVHGLRLLKNGQIGKRNGSYHFPKIHIA